MEEREFKSKLELKRASSIFQCLSDPLIRKVLLCAASELYTYCLLQNTALWIGFFSKYLLLNALSERDVVRLL